jgi:hypothetical protein
MNKRNLLPRIIASPFVFGLMTVSYSIAIFRDWFLFLRYGGEFVKYKEKDPSATLQTVYNAVKERSTKTYK